MHHLLEHTNQDIKRNKAKTRTSTVHKTEYQSKRSPTGKPQWGLCLFLALFSVVCILSGLAVVLMVRSRAVIVIDNIDVAIKMSCDIHIDTEM